MLPLLLAAVLLPAADTPEPSLRVTERTWRVCLYAPVSGDPDEMVRFCVYQHDRVVVDDVYTTMSHAVTLSTGARKIDRAAYPRLSKLLEEDGDVREFVSTLGLYWYFDRKWPWGGYWKYHPPSTDRVMHEVEVACRCWEVKFN